MFIRNYQVGEEQELWTLFYNTIHKVNSNDYSKNQLEAWAPREMDLAQWKEKTKQRRPFVCVLNDKITGYSDLQPNGYIDHFFCHHQYQRQGVGSALMQHIHLLAAQNHLTRLQANVSLSAKNFFETKGFEVVTDQLVLIRGEKLINYKMQKQLTL